MRGLELTAPKKSTPSSGDVPVSPQKERVRVKVSQVVGHRTLETAEDVERFTEELKKKLLARIGGNIRIVVE